MYAPNTGQENAYSCKRILFTVFIHGNLGLIAIYQHLAMLDEALSHHLYTHGSPLISARLQPSSDSAASTLRSCTPVVGARLLLQNRRPHTPEPAALPGFSPSDP